MDEDVQERIAHIRTLPAIRERCEAIFDAAQHNQLKHFDIDLSQLDDVAAFVADLIKRDFGANFAAIPPHGRWQHLNSGGHKRLEGLLQSWGDIDKEEKLRRLIDLFVVAVFLDAGAGNTWSYTNNDERYSRSEGIAVACYAMFDSGAFSSDSGNPHQVDAARLETITEQDLAEGLQVSEKNPIADLTGRVQLLNRLGKALSAETFFRPGKRPGFMLDYLLALPETKRTADGSPIIQLPDLWHVLIQGFATIWDRSKRLIVDGTALGDAWHSDSLPPSSSDQLADIVPFHKLTQWVTYSLMTPFTTVLGAEFIEAQHLTGLPEYRNGGLFVDLGLLSLKQADVERGNKAFEAASPPDIPASEAVPLFRYDDPVTVEWRALTVCLLDRLSVSVNKKLGAQLSLAQMLEAGSWKGGREIAAQKRPSSKGPPIMVVGDGTLF